MFMYSTKIDLHSTENEFKTLGDYETLVKEHGETLGANEGVESLESKVQNEKVLFLKKLKRFAQDKADRAKRFAQDKANRAKAAAKKASELAAKKAREAAENAKREAAKKAKELAEKAKRAAAEKLKQAKVAAEKAAKKAKQLAEKVKREAAEKLKKAEEAAKKAKRKAEHALKKAKQLAAEKAKKIAEAAKKAKKIAEEKLKKAKDEAAKKLKQVKEAAKKISKKTKEFGVKFQKSMASGSKKLLKMMKEGSIKLLLKLPKGLLAETPLGPNDDAPYPKIKSIPSTSRSQEFRDICFGKAKLEHSDPKYRPTNQVNRIIAQIAQKGTQTRQQVEKFLKGKSFPESIKQNIFKLMKYREDSKKESKEQVKQPKVKATINPKKPKRKVVTNPVKRANNAKLIPNKTNAKNISRKKKRRGNRKPSKKPYVHSSIGNPFGIEKVPNQFKPTAFDRKHILK